MKIMKMKIITIIPKKNSKNDLTDLGERTENKLIYSHKINGVNRSRSQTKNVFL